MIFGLEQETMPKVPEYNFKFKQKVHLENVPVFKSASSSDFIKLVTGDYYIHNPKDVRGFIKLAASERDCDVRMDTLWYAKVKDILDCMNIRRQ